ncbi:MAG: MBL fold metallo-hydrolase [Methylomonas sp.]|jgi:metallo-beta-lactamase family protein|uniref:MBL fold metallo-hydrolase RNA specificity domain-containing protein n=1 Tax=Methylomonas sp. TaxID=418 RepID=UPI0025E3E93B|nr:MBL fold metallo-hydrolase [Methylomonas sp.]MCK9605239.1 MBL fold metallo-hydrolase [Methylomonas sp.]
MVELTYPTIKHHGAIDGVTGSCHELFIDADNSVLIDCGLFQGAEVSGTGAGANQLAIDFALDNVRALLVTHCHIDHVGRIPYLVAAGFRGPIYCSEPTAKLLPLVLEDAVAVGISRDRQLIEPFIELIKSRLVAVPYAQWQAVTLAADCGSALRVKFNPAGHILGSAYIECEVTTGKQKQRIVFSGDLGGPYTPLLPAPKSPYQADVLVLESTYGNRLHENRKQRQAQLQQLIGRCLQNSGVILIPAFSIGRTQELLYELEDIIHRHKTQAVAKGLLWQEMEIIVDSPLASRFTEVYKQLKPYWDAEAKARLRTGRHPLAFEQLTTVNNHQDHLAAVSYLQKTAKPCIVIAAGGMCAGGRIVNYLKALIEDKRTDILLVGYQAAGTPGRDIQQYGPKHGYVELDGRRYTINAGVYTLNGYSAHADRNSLLRFVKGMRNKPSQIRLIHGDDAAKKALQQALMGLFPEIRVLIP